MAKDAIRLIFKIEAFQPDTMPMGRLAEYMADLAALLGEKADVHFVSLEDGCVQLVHEVSFTAWPKITDRIAQVSHERAPAEAMNAYRSLNRKLAADNTFASYGDANTPFMLDFPGARSPKPIEILPVQQPGVLVGVVQGLGGRAAINDARVPVYVDTGDTVHTCVASRAVAKGLGRFVLGEERRFEGSATWRRDDNGAWSLARFVIAHHEPIEARTLSEVVSQLRSVPSRLGELRDPWGEIMRDRYEDGEPH